MAKFYSMKKIRAQNGSNVGRIDIYGEISAYEFWGDEKTPAKFIEDLNKLGTVSEIEVHIFSNGGDPFAALAMYEEINRRTEKVNVYIDGIAASAATLILCAGDTVYMNETAMLMVHNPMQLIAFDTLNAQEARELADELDTVREPMIAAYMKKSKKTREEVIALMDGETGSGTWLTASTAKDFGLADEFTPENKKPAEVAAMIKPGVYNYRGHRIDLTSYEEAAEKTAGIINSKGGDISMGFFKKNKKNQKAAKTKVNPKAEVTFVEMVCPSCSGKVNLNAETGEIFAGNAQQSDGDNPEEGKEATLARRMPGNVKASIYTVDCPHCGNDFQWDTDVNADGGTGQTTTKAIPLGGKPAQSSTEPNTVAEASEAVCPSCGVQVPYDTETAEQGVDTETGTEGYLLTCPDCKTQFIEPLEASEPEVIPVGASAEYKAAYRAGVLAERNRQVALDEMVHAAPGLADMIQAAKKSGASAETMSRNVIKAMAAGNGGNVGNAGAIKFAAALGNDIKNSGVNNLKKPNHAGEQKSVFQSAYDRYAAEYNKGRGEKEHGKA